MKWLLYLLIVLVLVFIVLMLIAPKEYKVERSTIINKTNAEVFNYLKFLKNQDSWAPWANIDPDMEKTYTSTDGEVGFISAWKSNHKKVGHGEQEITKIVDGQRIDTELRFLKPFKSTSNGYLLLDDVDGGTKVTWGFEGEMKPPMNIMMLFMNMEKSAGSDFETGLQNLKEILEKE